MPPGALLIHGFTATPDCLESLAGPLKRAGFVVETPLLAGHGTTVQDLARTTWGDWYQGISQAFEGLQRRTGSVAVAGLSLGGLLGLMLASEFPVARLALLATPVFFTGFLLRRVLPVIGRTPLRKIYRYQRKWLGPAIADPEGRRLFRSYLKMPIKSLMQIVRLQEEVSRRLSSITVPTLILHSPHDNTAPYENMAYLKENLGSKKVERITLERSNHVLTMDFERDRVAEEVLRFFGGKE